MASFADDIFQDQWTRIQALTPFGFLHELNVTSNDLMDGDNVMPEVIVALLSRAGRSPA